MELEASSTNSAGKERANRAAFAQAVSSVWNSTHNFLMARCCRSAQLSPPLRNVLLWPELGTASALSGPVLPHHSPDGRTDHCLSVCIPCQAEPRKAEPRTVLFPAVVPAASHYMFVT